MREKMPDKVRAALHRNNHAVFWITYLWCHQDQWLFGVSPEGIGFVFMWVSLAIGWGVAMVTAPPPQDVQDLVEDIRVPGTRKAHGAADEGMAPIAGE